LSFNAISATKVRVTASTSKSPPDSSSNVRPIVIDLGRTSGKKIKDLKKGEGIYHSEVEPTIERLRSQLGSDLDGKELLPVVIIYEKKAKRKTIFDIIG
jgi:hypothetical protein